MRANCERFPSASVIKAPLLLAWLVLERLGQVSSGEICNLDEEPQVQGSGFSWLLRARQLPYQDVLLMMMALSDNLCTNLVIRRAGQARLNTVFTDALGLTGTELQRKMMDFEARARGLDNWIGVQDCIRLFTLFRQLSLEERAWVEPVLLANTDTSLLLRDLPRDLLKFYHKSGSIPNDSGDEISNRVLHDWGYTEQSEIFLLTHRAADESALNHVFGELGQLLLEQDQ